MNNYGYPIALNMLTGNNKIIFAYHTQIHNKIEEIINRPFILYMNHTTHIALLLNITKFHHLNSLYKKSQLGQHIGLNMAFPQILFSLTKSR
jgi:hypothetical protein